MKIRIDQIKPSHIRHEVLPEGFIARVQKFKEVLKEVETTSLEETVSNFQRDLHPEAELMIWENIARLYRLALDNEPNLNLPKKKKIFSLLLLSTTMPV